MPFVKHNVKYIIILFTLVSSFHSIALHDLLKSYFPFIFFFHLFLLHSRQRAFCLFIILPETFPSLCLEHSFPRIICLYLWLSFLMEQFIGRDTLGFANFPSHFHIQTMCLAFFFLDFCYESHWLALPCFFRTFQDVD